MDLRIQNGERQNDEQNEAYQTSNAIIALSP
jgi:hypothetical protein